jgi:hypothetical protein
MHKTWVENYLFLLNDKEFKKCMVPDPYSLCQSVYISLIPVRAAHLSILILSHVFYIDPWPPKYFNILLYDS